MSGNGAEGRIDLLAALRDYAAAYGRFGAHAGRAMRLPVGDVEALSEIIRGEDEGAPLAPVRLAARTGLTSGATNAQIDRLERAGYVRRSRESRDRRIVTLRATAAARAGADAFAAGPAARLDAVLRRTDPQQLAIATGLIARLSATLSEIDAALEQERRSRAPATTGAVQEGPVGPSSPSAGDPPGPSAG